MSEFIKSKWLDARVIAATAGVALLGAGCSAVPHTESKFGKTPAIPRCFTHPLPRLFRDWPDPKLPKFKAGQTYAEAIKSEKSYQSQLAAQERHNIGELPALTLPVEDGYTQNDPIYVPGIDDKIDASIVQIDAGEWSGTGFLTEDAEGREVVVTAAHVVGLAKMKTLAIEGENRVQTHPIGGCYIYEEKGHFKKLDDTDGAPVELDVAVLRLPKDIGRHTLKLSSKPVKRGQWLDFGNYQGFHEPGDPANYTGVVISRPHDLIGFDVLTGTHKLKVPVTVGEVEDNVIQAGASGGPVTDLRGKVVGISVAGDKDGYYTDGDKLKILYNVRMPGAKFGDRHGFVPETATLVPSGIISKVLHSKRG